MIFLIYSNSYQHNVKQIMNIFQIFIELKSFFVAPHLPATARVSPHGEPARPGPKRGGSATPRERAADSYG